FLLEHRLEHIGGFGAGDQIATGRRLLRSGAEEQSEVISLLQPGAMPRIGCADRFDRRAVGRFDDEMFHDANPPLSPSTEDVTDRFVTRRIRTGQLHVKWNIEAKAVARAAKSAERQAGRELARDKVFAVAADLFYRKGIHAVGVEEIVREADVAKISLYRSF